MRCRAALLAVLPALVAGPGAAQFGGEGDRPFYEPPPSLPETLRGTVAVPPAGPDPRGAELATLREIFPALAACWTVPPALARLERGEITLRLSLRRDGTLRGEPRVTFASLSADGRARGLLVEAAMAAIRRCTPLALSPGLGAAVAGRPLAIRFVYQGPRGQGV